MLALVLATSAGCGGGGGGGAGGGGGGGGGVTPVTSGSGTWTVMFYLTDNNSLHGNVPFFFDQVQAVGATAAVNVVWESDSTDPIVDSSPGFKRLHFSGTTPLVEQESAHVDMVTGGTELEAFVRWAKQNYPATHYALVINDHGGEIQGFGADDAVGTGLLCTYPSIKAAFATFPTTLGQPLDIVVWDACLMAGVELDQIESGNCNFRIGSEETSFAEQYRHDQWLAALETAPTSAPSTVVSSIFTTTVTEMSSPQPGAPGGYLAQSTISAVDLTRVGAVVTAMDGLGKALVTRLGQPGGFAEISALRAKAVTFGTSELSPQPGNPGFFADIGNFCALASTDPVLQSACASVQTALQQAVLSNQVGSPQYSGAAGVSVYFPANATVNAGFPQFGQAFAATTFAQTSWGTFLQEYLALSGAAPSSPTNVSASSGAASPASPVTVSFDIADANLVDTALVIEETVNGGFLFLGEFDQPNAITPGSYQTQWAANLLSISDGTHVDVAPIAPLRPGSQQGLSLLSVQWTPVTGGGPVNAALILDSSLRVLGVLSGAGSAEVQLHVGDQFKVIFTVFKTGGGTSTLLSTITLTPGPSGLTVGSFNAASGNYAVGIACTNTFGLTNAGSVLVTVP